MLFEALRFEARLPTRRRVLPMNRRRFAFWIGFGLFGLSKKLHAQGLDTLAAALMRRTESQTQAARDAAPEHWRAALNKTWRWYERENLIDGKWVLTGVTTPVHRRTNEPYQGGAGYLDESLVPQLLKLADQENYGAVLLENSDEPNPGQPDAERRARHGRPPSKWLRSLRAPELRIWLAKIDVPEAGVSGMTFWEHLTRDHYFDPDRIAGLTEDEQAKLHAAAHHGY